METLLTYVNAGGSIGIWVLVFVVWKFDRRLLIIEEWIKHHMKVDDERFSLVNSRIEKLKNETD